MTQQRPTGSRLGRALDDLHPSRCEDCTTDTRCPKHRRIEAQIRVAKARHAAQQGDESARDELVEATRAYQQAVQDERHGEGREVAWH